MLHVRCLSGEFTQQDSSRGKATKALICSQRGNIAQTVLLFDEIQLGATRDRETDAFLGIDSTDIGNDLQNESLVSVLSMFLDQSAHLSAVISMKKMKKPNHKSDIQ